MECAFKVGDKVVCVDAAATTNVPRDGVTVDLDLDGLSFGEVYTVREVYLDPIWNAVSVRLVEIERPQSFDFSIGVSPYEAGYDPARFRPVAERGTETGMSILRELLNKTDKPARVEA